LGTIFEWLDICTETWTSMRLEAVVDLWSGDCEFALLRNDFYVSFYLILSRIGGNHVAQ